MEIFLNNFYLIWLNSFLALVAVLFGWLMSKAHSIFAKTWTGFIWLLFLPNTVYILTDISHIFEDWNKVDNLFKFILLIQYSLFSIVGIVTFVVSVYFFQVLIERKKKKMTPFTFLTIAILNIAVGFGVILGGIERTNSWHIFTNPLRVKDDILSVLSSQEMFLLSIGIGILANIIYFTCVETVITWENKLFKK